MAEIEVNEAEVQAALAALEPRVRRHIADGKRLEREIERGLAAISTIPADIERHMAEALAALSAFAVMAEFISEMDAGN